MEQLEFAIRSGFIRTEWELRSRFRHLAIERHPDSGGDNALNESFWILVEDFQRAMDLLRKRGKEPRESGWDPCECIEALEDLVSSGFPISEQIQPQPRGYLSARQRFLNEYSKRDGGAGMFVHFERELRELRRPGVVWNPLLGTVKLILMNTPGLRSVNAFRQRAVRRWLDSLKSESQSEWRLDAEARQALEGRDHIVPFLDSLISIANQCAAQTREPSTRKSEPRK